MRKKIYGESRIQKCPFCGARATVRNQQGFPVCRDHKDSKMNQMYCICGEPLEIKHGKYGVFFLCMQCGPINQSKAFEVNDIKDTSNKGNKNNKINKQGSETIDSNDPRYFS